jgi:hypothetical protein
LPFNRQRVPSRNISARTLIPASAQNFACCRGAHRAGDPNPYPQRIYRQISKRHVFDIHGFDGFSLGARRDRGVGRRYRGAAKDQRLLSQPAADAARPDNRRIAGDRAAAAEPDRQQIPHTEQPAHAADLDDRIRFARKAAAQLADIGRSAADIDHHRVGDPRQKRSAADRIGRRLDPMHDGTVGEQHRIGIGPPDIDPDPSHI